MNLDECFEIERKLWSLVCEEKTVEGIPVLFSSQNGTSRHLYAFSRDDLPVRFESHFPENDRPQIFGLKNLSGNASEFGLYIADKVSCEESRLVVEPVEIDSFANACAKTMNWNKEQEEGFASRMHSIQGVPHEFFCHYDGKDLIGTSSYFKVDEVAVLMNISVASEHHGLGLSYEVMHGLHSKLGNSIWKMARTQHPALARTLEKLDYKRAGSFFIDSMS